MIRIRNRGNLKARAKGWRSYRETKGKDEVEAQNRAGDHSEPPRSDEGREVPGQGRYVSASLVSIPSSPDEYQTDSRSGASVSWWVQAGLLPPRKAPPEQNRLGWGTLSWLDFGRQPLLVGFFSQLGFDLVDHA